ncbi:hypothetical protein T492DRAFT_893682 [Pavlovales sp. CCMP2436]|nr:hypothetical protein T492DRAFT_893682 [Pavlovales sp. CCMP2436]
MAPDVAGGAAAGHIGVAAAARLFLAKHDPDAWQRMDALRLHVGTDSTRAVEAAARDEELTALREQLGAARQFQRTAESFASQRARDYESLAAASVAAVQREAELKALLEILSIAEALCCKDERLDAERRRQAAELAELPEMMASAGETASLAQG